VVVDLGQRLSQPAPGQSTKQVLRQAILDAAQVVGYPLGDHMAFALVEPPRTANGEVLYGAQFARKMSRVSTAGSGASRAQP
jgi:hypothetical protein